MKYIVIFIAVTAVICIAAEIAFKLDMKKHKKELEKGYKNEISSK